MKFQIKRKVQKQQATEHGTLQRKQSLTNGHLRRRPPCFVGSTRGGLFEFQINFQIARLACCRRALRFHVLRRERKQFEAFGCKERRGGGETGDLEFSSWPRYRFPWPQEKTEIWKTAMACSFVKFQANILERCLGKIMRRNISEITWQTSLSYIKNSLTHVKPVYFKQTIKNRYLCPELYWREYLWTIWSLCLKTNCLRFLSTDKQHANIDVQIMFTLSK